MEKIGCYYLHFFYPSYLFLDYAQPFLFKMGNIQYAVIVIRHLSSLITNDYDNKIIHVEFEDDNHKYELEKKEIGISDKSLVITLENNVISYVVDYHKLLFKEFYFKDYTEIIISFETKEKAKNIDLAQKAMNFFIDSYRLVSNDILTLTLDKMPYVSNVFKEYFHPYSAEELQLPTEKRSMISRAVNLQVKTVQLPFWNTQGKKFQTDEKKNAESLVKFLSENQKPDALSEFILKAREELYIHKNYKYSFIESWTTLEIAITSILKKIKVEKGISKNKVDMYEGEVGISYLLNIELPLVYTPNNEVFKKLIIKVDGVRKILNKVIHENRSITEQEAAEALATCIEFLNHMGFKSTHLLKAVYNKDFLHYCC